jgi:hypothetical protein
MSSVCQIFCDYDIGMYKKVNGSTGTQFNILACEQQTFVNLHEYNTKTSIVCEKSPKLKPQVYLQNWFYPFEQENITTVENNTNIVCGLISLGPQPVEINKGDKVGELIFDEPVTLEIKAQINA